MKAQSKRTICLLGGLVIISITAFLAYSMSAGPSREESLAAFTADLASAIEQGRPVIGSLLAARSKQSDPQFQLTIGRVAGGVQSGMSLSEAMAQHPEFFSQDYIDAVRNGEKTVTLDLALQKLAQSQ